MNLLTGLGMNVDALNPDGRPDPALLTAAGVAWVRLVAHVDVEARNYVTACQQAGLRVLLAVARESIDETAPLAALVALRDVFPDVPHWQIGNEPDLHSPSSWTLSPTDYAALWDQATGVFGDRTLVLAGLASGNPQWLADTLPLLARPPDLLAVHPYGQRPTEDWPSPGWGFGYVGDLLDAYRRVTKAIPLLVSEFGANVDEGGEDLQAAYLPRMARTLLARQVPAAVFCWSDGMVPSFGVIRPDGTPRPSFAALQGVAMPTDKPEFVLGFADLAARLGPDVVGEPKEDEGYFPDGSHSLQVTSKGVMIYSKAGNQAGFLPFA